MTVTTARNLRGGLESELSEFYELHNKVQTAPSAAMFRRTIIGESIRFAALPKLFRKSNHRVLSPLLCVYEIDPLDFFACYLSLIPFNNFASTFFNNFAIIMRETMRRRLTACFILWPYWFINNKADHVSANSCKFTYRMRNHVERYMNEYE